MDDAIRPYAGSSGWSGSATSEERAQHDDAAGKTTARQRIALMLLSQSGADGLTWKELAQGAGLHHGEASGVLSRMHMAGIIERLAERRNRCQVYVMPTHLAGRETTPHGSTVTHRRNAAAESLADAAEQLLSAFPSLRDSSRTMLALADALQEFRGTP